MTIMFILNISFQRKHEKFEDNIRAGISTSFSQKTELLFK